MFRLRRQWLEVFNKGKKEFSKNTFRWCCNRSSCVFSSLPAVTTTLVLFSPWECVCVCATEAVLSILPGLLSVDRFCGRGHVATVQDTVMNVSRCASEIDHNYDIIRVITVLLWSDSSRQSGWTTVKSSQIWWCHHIWLIIRYDDVAFPSPGVLISGLLEIMRYFIFSRGHYFVIYYVWAFEIFLWVQTQGSDTFNICPSLWFHNISSSF